MVRWKMASLVLLLGVLLFTGCTAQTTPQDHSFIVNQLSGTTGTSFNGEMIRTRSYDGVRNYMDDNVTIFVTDERGQTIMLNSNPPR
ncbi:hypothetical protein [Ammoniphilus sp. CFH 90114]|uniref:hypothetical protein n=1 Tax=Ammoniphilus sp. CFH 90114 TaxID=2493665 RepID=UPI00100FA6C1|nr:hypothetical protein [Ammoniphilus sp. CFH 90114]RXT02871.1 hypothetical protein EIZ39_24075 [Ammoniphilus sp. CFH 90114]